MPHESAMASRRSECLVMFASPLLIALIVVLITVVQLEIVRVACEKLGLTEHSGYLLLMVALTGSVINLPLFSVASKGKRGEGPYDAIYRLLAVPRPRFTGRTIIAVNVGGALTPLAFSIYLLAHNPITSSQVFYVVGSVAAVSYLTSVPIRGVGIAMPFLIAPLVAALVSRLVATTLAAPLAYVGGSLGVLIGADLMRLGNVRSLGAPVASIGGAGAFDGIFLAGVIAVLLV